MGEQPTLLAIRRAALAVYTATGEHPNAVFLDGTTLDELIDETTLDDVVLDAQGRHHVAGMVILSARCIGPTDERIVLPVHAELGDVIQAQSRPGATA